MRLAFLFVALTLAALATAQTSAPSSAPSVYIPECYPSKAKAALSVITGVGSTVVSGSVPTGGSSRYDTYVVWVCDVSVGYRTVVTLFASTDNTFETAWKYVFGSVTAAQAAADCAVTCSAPTQSEAALIQSLGDKYRPRAFVSINGTLPSRNVYVKKPDGVTRNTNPVGPMVAIGVACDETDRIAGTNFYSVWNKPDVTGAPLPHVYVDCGVPTFLLPVSN